MIIRNNMAQSIEKVQSGSSVQPKKKIQNSGPSFEQVLSNQINEKQEVKFSKHALKRLDYRQINLDEVQMGKIQQGVESARDKGVKESLMLVDDIALVVNIENNTVITALATDETKNHVFTNIDGTVVL